MKVIFISLCAAMIFALSGCLVTSFHPLFNVNQLILVPQLEGTWHEKDGTTWQFIRSGKDNYYNLLITEKQATDSSVNHSDSQTASAAFETRFGKIGNMLFMDFYPKAGDEGYGKSLNENYEMLLIPVHHFFLVDLGGDSLSFSGMNYEWFKDKIDHKKIKIKHEFHENSILMLTAGTRDLQKFLKQYAGREDFHGKSQILYRTK